MPLLPALDVEDIDSVYEAMIGFRVEVVQGPSIAVKPKKAHGVAVALNLDEADRPCQVSQGTDRSDHRLHEFKCVQGSQNT